MLSLVLTKSDGDIYVFFYKKAEHLMGFLIVAPIPVSKFFAPATNRRKLVFRF